MRFKKIIAFFIMTLFFVNEAAGPAYAQFAVRPAGSSEVASLAFPFIHLSPDEGTVENLIPGTGPVIFHIQEAHGSYEVQRNILEILRQLRKEHGIDLIFMEGSAFPLNPDLLRSPDKENILSAEAADALAKKSLLSGPELFLLEDSGVKAYGIEDTGPYLSNGKVFHEVLLQKEKTQAFAQQMNMQIERLGAPYLSQDLRGFLSRLKDFEEGLIPMDEWLRVLQRKADKVLNLDLENPYFQLQWPMLLHLYTFQKIQQAFDKQTFLKERPAFLKSVKPYLSDALYKEVEKHLTADLISNHLPAPQTSVLFEQMAGALPADFDYETYPNVNRFIGLLILRSELKPVLLMKEMEQLEDKIAQTLADSPEAKKITGLLKSYRLLNRLLSLELSADTYEKILAAGETLRPSRMAEAFLAVNQDKRVKDLKFEHLEEMDRLYDLALKFYSGTHERDRSMFANVEKILKETGKTKAAIISGGFHTSPMRDYFAGKNYTYALISPKVTKTEGLQQSYVAEMLARYTYPEGTRQSTYKGAPYLTTAPSQLEQLGVSVPRIAAEVSAALSGLPPEQVSALKNMEWFRLARGETARSDLRMAPKKAEAGEAESRVKPSSTLLLYEADYGFLPEDSELYQFAYSRLKQMMPDVAEEDLPPLKVFASKGAGVNALAFDNGTIAVTPELLAFVENLEELDYVLLHEINHILRGHHAEKRESEKLRKWSKSLGLSRLHEYEADAMAFYQMADESRNSNPMGAIRFLEGLKAEGEMWDEAHGSLTDRILNLKSLLGFLDLLDIGDSDLLTPASAGIKAKIASFESGGRLVRLLSQPPSDAQAWSSLVNEAKIILDEAGVNLLNQAIAHFYRQYESANEQLKDHETGKTTLSSAQIGKLESERSFNRALLNHALRQWNTRINLETQSLPDAERVLVKIMRLEIEAGFPATTATEDLLPDTLKIFVKEYRAMLSNDNLMKELINASSHLDSPFTANRFYDFAIQTSLEQLVPQMVFDEDDGTVNLEAYYDASLALLEKAREAEEIFGTKSLEANRYEKARLRHFLETAVMLADLGTLDQFEPDTVLPPGLPDALSETAYVTNHLDKIAEKMPKATETTREFLSQGWLGQLSTGFESQVKEMKRLYKALKKRLDPNAITFDYKKAYDKKLMRDVIKLIRALPKQFPEKIELEPGITFSEGVFFQDLIRNLFITAEDEGTYSMNFLLPYVHFYQLLFDDPDQFYDVLFELFNSPKQGISAEQALELVQAAADPRKTAQYYGVESRLKNLDGAWEETASGVLQIIDGTVKKTDDVTEAFATLEFYLTHWPMDPVHRDSLGNPAVYFELADLFSRGAHLLESAPALSSKERDRYNYDLSFIVPDTAVRPSIQSYFFHKLIEDSTFKEAVHILFDQFPGQAQLGGTRGLEFIIEELAQTPEDLELLKEKIKSRIADRNKASGKMAAALIPDLLGNLFFDSEAKYSLLEALLKSAEDDTSLRNWLAAAWARTYSSSFDEILQDPPDFPITTSGRRLVHEISEIPYHTPSEGLFRFYQLNEQGKYVLLRTMLAGENGVLHEPILRQLLATDFLEQSLKKGENPALSGMLRDVLLALFESAPTDELYLLLNPLLVTRIANPPAENGLWSDQVDHIMATANAFNGLKEHGSAKEKALVHDFLSFLMTGIDDHGFMSTEANKPLYGDADDTGYFVQKMYDLIPSDFVQRDSEKLGPIEMILEIAGQLGAPGVRFLQLLGQTIEIPEEYRDSFGQVYDAMKGQSKLSAWETIKRHAPEYASQIKRIIRKVGGGSLFTVFEVELKDGTREVVRVMNPNALYHARFFIKVLREAVEKLTSKDKKYAQALPLIDLIEQWITQELLDTSFEETDPVFREKWSGWTQSGFSASVVVPVSRPTGTVKVQPESYVRGYHEALGEDKEDNFTGLENFEPEKRKELVALALRHYLSQIMEPVTASGESLVHSDVSAGNLRVNEDGNVAILDRGRYLRFNESDRAFLGSLLMAPNAESKVALFLDWVWALPENAEAVQSLTKEDIAAKILAKQIDGKSPDEVALDAMVVIQSEGLRIPLDYNLLFKNLNALRQLAVRAGFDAENAILGALTYDPSTKRSDLRVPSVEEKAFLPGEGEEIALHFLVSNLVQSSATKAEKRKKDMSEYTNRIMRVRRELGIKNPVRFQLTYTFGEENGKEMIHHLPENVQLLLAGQSFVDKLGEEDWAFLSDVNIYTANYQKLPLKTLKEIISAVSRGEKPIISPVEEFTVKTNRAQARRELLLEILDNVPEGETMTRRQLWERIAAMDAFRGTSLHAVYSDFSSDLKTDIAIKLRNHEKLNRSDLRSEDVTVHGPDGPILIPVTPETKQAIEAFDMPPEDPEQGYEWVEDLSDFLTNTDWSFATEDIHGRSPQPDEFEFFTDMYNAPDPDNAPFFGWLLENLTDAELDLHDMEIIQAGFALETQIHHFQTELNFRQNPLPDFAWYWIVRSLAALQKLESRSAETNKAHREIHAYVLRESIQAFINSILVSSTDIDGDTPYHFLENRLIELGASQPELAPLAAGALDMAKDPSDDFNYTTLDLLNEALLSQGNIQEEESGERGNTAPEDTFSEFEKIAAVHAGAIAGFDAEDPAEALDEITNAVRENAERETDAWKAPLETLRENAAPARIVVYEYPYNSHLKEDEGVQVPALLQFLTASLETMAEDGITDWLWQWEKMDDYVMNIYTWLGTDAPAMKKFLEDVEGYLRYPKNINFSDYVNLPQNKEKPLDVIQSILFWQKLHDLVQKYDINIKFTGAFPSGKGKNTALDVWLEDVQARGKRLVVISNTPSPAKTPGLLQQENFKGFVNGIEDIFSVRLKEGITEYNSDSIDTGHRALEYAAYQVSQGYGTGDYRSVGIPVRGNDPLILEARQIMNDYAPVSLPSYPPHWFFSDYEVDNQDFLVITMPPQDTNENGEAELPESPDEVPEDSSDNAPADTLTRSDLRAGETTEAEESVFRVAEISGHVVPLSARERLGDAAYFNIVHRVTLNLKPETAEAKALPPVLSDFIKNQMPVFNELIQKQAGEPGRVFGNLAGASLPLGETEIDAPLDFVEWAPLFILLSQRPELEYTVIVDSAREADFRKQLGSFASQYSRVLGFNPLTELKNFHIETADTAADVRRAVGPSLSQGAVPTAVVARQDVIDRFNVMNNLARVLLKEPRIHSDVFLLAATALDELVKNSLMIYDEESLRSLSGDTLARLVQEIQALSELLTSA